MKRLRSHTMRIAVVIMLCAGFSLYMARPAQAEQSSEAFTSWFGAMAKSADVANLEQELNDLRKSDGHLGKLLEKASEIISRNNSDFNFPFTKSTASQHVYQLLLIEWSQFQTGNEMAGTPTQPNVKLLSPLSLDTLGAFGTTVVEFSKSCFSFFAQNLNTVRQTNHTISVAPMISGIAICAP